MANDRKVLINALQKELIPFLENKGFQVQLSNNRKRRWYFPLGTLTRKRGKIEEKIEIQFEKNGKPKFVLNLRVSSKGKFERSICRLHSLPIKVIPLKWFSFPVFTWPLNIETKAKKAAHLVIELYPQVEEWFLTRKAGPHVKYAYFSNGSWQSN